MKKIFYLFFVTLIGVKSFSQNVAINTTGSTADSSAMLDVSANNKGILIPRMTTTERQAIQSPANGLLVFDITTNSFWYFSSSWKEIGGSGGGGAFTLPYNGSTSDPDKIFSITNEDSSNGSAAIYGKGGANGIGIIPGINIGVWGDNSRGIGILGTSVNGVGAYGLSLQNHGVSGYATNNSFAGVYGAHANEGAGIMGEAGSGGIGVYGRTTGLSGNAGLFENNNSSSPDTVVKIINSGTGVSEFISNQNAASTGALISGNHYGKGSGIFMKLWNAQNTNPGFYMYQYGNGDGLYVGTNKSKAARFYSNAGNADTSVTITHDGTGPGLQINLNSPSNANNALNVISKGLGNAIYGESGGGYAIYGRSNRKYYPAIYGENIVDSGYGIQGLARGYDGVAIKGTAGGNHSFSSAALFENRYLANDKNLVIVQNEGIGTDIQIQNYNSSNDKPMIEMKNQGSGEFLSFFDGSYNLKFMVENSGDIKTSGNLKASGKVTVKDGMGIVRNSTTSQLRVETINAPITVAGGVNIGPNQYIMIPVTFNTAFSSAPVVYVGNILNYSQGATYLTATVTDVTTTGCHLNLRNTTGQTLNITGAWQMIAMGAE